MTRVRRLGEWLRRFLTAPWPLIFREAWYDRNAKWGDLQLMFMDIRKSPNHDPHTLEKTLTDALERLSIAGQGFGELVTSHLLMVVATDYVGQAYVLPSRVWASTFQDRSRTDGHILACMLIWAATSIRLARDAKAAGQPLKRISVRNACWNAQQRFLRQFDDAEMWIDYMDPSRDRGLGEDGAA